VLPASKAAADTTTGRQRRTTLAAIAAEAGVSLPRVSKVVNRRRDVAPATRALVERLLDEHHHTRAGARRNRRSGLVDLVFNDLDSPWAVEILDGLIDGLPLRTNRVELSTGLIVRESTAPPRS
jgi:DNA-binding LacI/PurR family transcriptional regulator